MTILLPIGICFFTFGIISYLADLRWHSEARCSLRKCTLFVSLFLRLMADQASEARATETIGFGTVRPRAPTFTFLLLFDFSAYSEMALGIALAIGLYGLWGPSWCIRWLARTSRNPCNYFPFCA